MDGLFQEIAPSRCSVPIMVLERLAKPPGVYSPCRFESYTLRLYEWERISLFAGGYALLRVEIPVLAITMHSSSGRAAFA